MEHLSVSIFCSLGEPYLFPTTLDIKKNFFTVVSNRYINERLDVLSHLKC